MHIGPIFRHLVPDPRRKSRRVQTHLQSGNPIAMGFPRGVSDGIRTRDRLDHNRMDPSDRSSINCGICRYFFEKPDFVGNSDMRGYPAFCADYWHLNTSSGLMDSLIVFGLDALVESSEELDSLVLQTLRGGGERAVS
jgi:hypothetical protein